ncbi:MULTISPECIES: lipoyl synthase [Acinetobacter]|jgi:lipoic acid synthetase|uniref:lipoyl synthase n=2 Tax=Moraxellaceae TaxID=468 RepID=UPI00044C8763|nr:MULTISPECIES: lipoyl synthase [Acinetobacter]MDQ9823687.1 lipoyl synthase [Acinetobacter sp. 163]EHU1209577.1 lipoyl synthase [Acinetobacter nosocomialis]EXH15706.1 lipoyl synthase [Acinetobacter sp. 1245593]MBM9558004.1 lipoyl synthase [Acinetobacter nosocomialis]MBP1507223.1 lipoyl synthase [Acinetobacter nosocomialis]
MDLKRQIETGIKLRGIDKVSRIPIKILPTEELPKKPEWIRAKITDFEEIQRIKNLLRQQKLHSVCEEAACPNLPECFGGGTATFMIMGDICTRRCPFCDVAHGRPMPLDENEPKHLAETVANLNLKYVVITSVDRDDLHDGGAAHFVKCIEEIRNRCPDTLIEILVPDFRGRLETALSTLSLSPPDVFNHNIETVPRLYKAMRPGSDYEHSLNLLKCYKKYCPDIKTKCGLMVGLGEIEAEVIALLNDLKDHDVDLVTIGQYLQPSKSHAPIHRFVNLQEFERYTQHGKRLGFKNIWSAPMVRSSYFADRQYFGEPAPKPFSREDVLS